MNKAPLLAIAAAALFVAGASPALAGERDHASFSFGVILNDGYRGPPPRYYERERYVEREPCDDDYRYRRSYYGRPYYYAPRERVVIVERGRRHWHHDHWRHGRDWDD
jgi:hypothetical protein